MVSLNTLSKSQLNENLPEICEWLSDMNWPVASSVASFLIENADRVASQLIEILGEQDVILKHNVLAYVAAEFSEQNLQPLIPVITQQIEMYAQQKKDEDITNFIDIASELLRKFE